jgi:hypothetical protein
MFPAPNDALPLPSRPDLAQYRKLAKELVRISRSGDTAALDAWAKGWIGRLVRSTGLILTPQMPVRLDRWATLVAEFARRRLAGTGGRPSTLADAQFVLARVHGFESWAKFVRHVDEVAHAGSATAEFESAADAVVNGDEDSLRRRLFADPELVRARSTREHRATLLHYVAANGVEGWRQRTPANIVEISRMLLDAGAEIDAEADLYGAGATTLGLAATSVHPERAGVQTALLALLLDRGARMDGGSSAGSGSLVKSCLANGRGQAAEFLAARGAALDLETAAGVGAIEEVRNYFDSGKKLKGNASDEQLRAGFLWACQFGRNRVIEYLLPLGFDLTAQDTHGQTALHHAVIGAQLETVKLLLRHGAPLEARNSYGGTVLGQAIWSAYNSSSPATYLPIIEELLAACAKVEPEMEEALAKLFRRRAIQDAKE